MKWLLAITFILSSCGDGSNSSMDSADTALSMDSAGSALVHSRAVANTDTKKDDTAPADSTKSPFVVNFSILSGDGSCLEYDDSYRSFKTSLAKGSVVSNAACSVTKASGRCTIEDTEIGFASVVYYAKDLKGATKTQKSCESLNTETATATYQQF